MNNSSFAAIFNTSMSARVMSIMDLEGLSRLLPKGGGAFVLIAAMAEKLVLGCRCCRQF